MSGLWFLKFEGKGVDVKIWVDMMANINASNNDKNIQNELYDANTFSNMENYVSYSKNVMRQEASYRILTKTR